MNRYSSIRIASLIALVVAVVAQAQTPTIRIEAGGKHFYELSYRLE